MAVSENTFLLKFSKKYVKVLLIFTQNLRNPTTLQDSCKFDGFLQIYMVANNMHFCRKVSYDARPLGGALGATSMQWTHWVLNPVPPAC